MIELNLLPDVKRELVHAQHARRRTIAIMVLVSICAVGAVVLLALYVYGGQFALGKLLDGSIDQKAKDLSSKQDINNYLTIQNQLKALPALHNEKLIYSRLFDYLPVVNPATPNNIRVSRLITDEARGTITINGYGRDYKAVTIFEDTLKNSQLSYDEGDENKQVPFLNSLTMSQVGLGEDANGNKVVTFTATLEYNEAAFNRSSKNTKLTVPSRITTESSQQIFGETSDGGEN